MIKTITFSILIALLTIVNSSEQQFEVFSFNEFEHLLKKQDENVYVINFWATWCKPCVEEIPAFNQLLDNYNNRNVEIIMVSLDFGKNVQHRIQKFKNTHNMKARIVILDDPDSNSWIDKVSQEWSGAIPATVIYNKRSRKFYEKSFTYEELEKELKLFL